jgi:spore maturation protein CgeB
VPTVLVVAGTQVTTSDLHLLYHRAFTAAGWRSVFFSHDSQLPFWEKAVQQARQSFSRFHFALVNRRLLAVARRERPALVFISGSNWYLWPETVTALRRQGAKVVLNEQHLQVFRPYQAACLRLYDHVFAQDGALLTLLRAESTAAPVSLLGPACDPREHRVLDLSPEDRSEFGADVVYLGFAYPNRIAMMESLLAFDVRLWGMGWDASDLLRSRFRPEPVHGLKKTKIYNAAAVTLNLQSTHYQVGGVTCRPFEVAACGGFCLTESRPDLASFFEPEREMATFSDVAELQRKLAHFLASPGERREIAERARQRALREHTYAHRVQQVLAETGF